MAGHKSVNEMLVDQYADAVERIAALEEELIRLETILAVLAPEVAAEIRKDRTVLSQKQ